MTDMRTTERLLEVIEESANRVLKSELDVQILEAVQELRRRGDTLVVGDDLRVVLDATDTWWEERYGTSWRTDPYYASDAAAYSRLENAIGGKTVGD